MDENGTGSTATDAREALETILAASGEEWCISSDLVARLHGTRTTRTAAIRDAVRQGMIIEEGGEPGKPKWYYRGSQNSAGASSPELVAAILEAFTSPDDWENDSCQFGSPNVVNGLFAIARAINDLASAVRGRP